MTEVHEGLEGVVAFATGKGDGIATVLVRAGAPIDVPGERGRGHLCVLERLAFGTDDLATNHIELLGRNGKRESDG